ncbi:MAG TPA: 6,7-dimethyl-8-ribityllumazine synthase [Methylomirabilota bacterium]|nr:6,7-dimethyl-8-ribityllumazine synthase [Methylomirabilota bacterium]
MEPRSPNPTVRAQRREPVPGRGRRGADRLRRSRAHRAVVHPSARLRQVSTPGKTAARVQNAHRGARVAIVRARWNDEITRALAQGAVQAALSEGAKIEEFEVAGSFELPPAVAMLARSGRFDAVVPLGCLIRGETPHFDVLAHAVARSLAELAASLPVAIPFGVLTCETIEQARARSSPDHNVGAEAMQAALELVSLRHAMASSTARASRSAATARSRSTRVKRRRSPGSR